MVFHSIWTWKFIKKFGIWTRWLLRSLPTPLWKGCIYAVLKDGLDFDRIIVKGEHSSGGHHVHNDDSSSGEWNKTKTRKTDERILTKRNWQKENEGMNKWLPNQISQIRSKRFGHDMSFQREYVFESCTNTEWLLGLHGDI